MAQQSFVLSAAVAQRRIIAWRWPLIGALTLLGLVGALGNAWDLYWHIMVGRDTFWIPPHTMMYAAVAVSGVSAAAVVLAYTLGPPSPHTVSLLGFRAPLGYIVLGLGALQMVISAPFDNWYHLKYGLDVTVWSPPHLIGFSGAAVMLSGVIIAATAERQRTQPLSAGQERAFYWLLVLLFTLVVRWGTFLNSTTLTLSWVLEPDRYAVASPWVGWWGLWASFFFSWTFVAAARCLPGRRAWTFPLAIAAIALLMRLVEFVVGAIGFALVLPWGSQTLREPFHIFFDYDLGLWVTTAVLLPPAFVVAAIARDRPRLPALRFGLLTGAIFGLLLAIQFVVLRPVFDLVPITLSMQLQVFAVCLVAGLLGGVIGAYQGDWLARFSR